MVPSIDLMEKVSTLDFAEAEVLDGAVGDRVGVAAGALQHEAADVAGSRGGRGLEGGLAGIRIRKSSRVGLPSRSAMSRWRGRDLRSWPACRAAAAVDGEGNLLWVPSSAVTVKVSILVSAAL